jgi:ABC-type thiamin/hydroxymethylpyrimidine transport system permease subunit
VAGAVAIVIVLLLIPVMVIMSGAVVAGVLGQFLTKDAEVRNDDSELLDLNV